MALSDVAVMKLLVILALIRQKWIDFRLVFYGIRWAAYFLWF